MIRAASKETDNTVTINSPFFPSSELHYCDPHFVFFQPLRPSTFTILSSSRAPAVTKAPLKAPPFYQTSLTKEDEALQ